MNVAVPGNGAGLALTPFGRAGTSPVWVGHFRRTGGPHRSEYAEQHGNNKRGDMDAPTRGRTLQR